jgi:dTDP-4-amino-4,6-dideoxygalactose transaminase
MSDTLLPIPFNRPHTTGREFDYIREAIDGGHLSGNGPFVERCARELERRTGAHRALMTHSCTGALEMAVILAGIGAGDEVIMPSFTFVSTANAVALRGGVPVFVDVRADTLNLDEHLLADAITPRTKAIIAVHYAGVACALDEIIAVATENELAVLEDAAQGIGSTYRARPLGGLGQFGALSFHETKNVHCGEGGALLVNEEKWVERAEVVQEKGTNRSRFFRGQVDKYTWVDLGSSFLLSEINAAFLWAQLERVDAITARRLEIWEHYHSAFADLEIAGLVRRPRVPEGCVQNAHMYYVLLPDIATRTRVIAQLADRGVHAVFHYVPLHSSEMGMRVGRSHGRLEVTDDLSDRLLRLPLWPDLTESEIEHVIEAFDSSVRMRRAPGSSAGSQRRTLV